MVPPKFEQIVLTVSWLARFLQQARRVGPCLPSGCFLHVLCLPWHRCALYMYKSRLGFLNWDLCHGIFIVRKPLAISFASLSSVPSLFCYSSDAHQTI